MGLSYDGGPRFSRSRSSRPRGDRIRCILDTEHSATEISLAENAIRADMHPADQYEVFAKLRGEEGLSAEDVAARFGVTAAVVKVTVEERPYFGRSAPYTRTRNDRMLSPHAHLR
jgi:hypothetical protein